MGKTRGVHETTPELRNRMVGMYEAGLGLREIAAAVNCSQRTVKRWLSRFEKEGTVETRERCGRKRATTSEQDEAIVRLATQTPITAAKAVLPALGLNCSVDTIRERLHKAGIHNWSPSRKHIQKIPLGDADGAAIQQAVWRPTGTQLGKKKTHKTREKTKKTGSVAKKKTLRKKSIGKNHSETQFPSESSKQQEQIHPVFNFQTSQSIQQPQQPLQALPPPLPPVSSLPQVPLSLPNDLHSSTLISSQANFDNGLNLVGPQPIYHSNINVSQNWSLDLGQAPHYSTNPSSSMVEQPHLQELGAQVSHTQQVQFNSRQIQKHIHDQQKQPHHFFGQQQLDQDQQPQLQQLDIPNTEPAKLIRSNSCSNSSSDQSSDSCNELSKESSQNHGNRKHKKKKKGGKAKGTLETSVEIRNRMIGMSEAGLSTLSIALAINRSERTVKRWLERWNKEGNVLTKERKGRKRITTKEQDEAIVAMATQHPLTAAKHVAPALGLNCSVDTIRERLHKAGIHSWKLGKKHGEGNAVHTVHLWQPSGNRPNKSKLPNEKRKRSTEKKSFSKRNFKKKTDEAPKIIPQSENIIPEQTPVQYHDPAMNYPPSMMQSIHMTQPLPNTAVAQASDPSDPIQQSLAPIVQQRPDCRMITPLTNQNNPIVSYSSCMIANNAHMDQPEPLNYEPFIWTF